MIWIKDLGIHHKKNWRYKVSECSIHGKSKIYIFYRHYLVFSSLESWNYILDLANPSSFPLETDEIQYSYLSADVAKDLICHLFQNFQNKQNFRRQANLSIFFLINFFTTTRKDLHVTIILKYHDKYINSSKILKKKN